MNIIDTFRTDIKNDKDKISMMKALMLSKEDMIVTILSHGFTGDLLIHTSLENPVWEDANVILDSQDWDKTPVKVFYDRRWVGFPELSEYDYKKDYILGQSYTFID